MSAAFHDEFVKGFDQGCSGCGSLQQNPVASHYFSRVVYKNSGEFDYTFVNQGILLFGWITFYIQQCCIISLCDFVLGR
jgi:hypothetical protein